MSRIGKKPIAIPKGVTVQASPEKVSVKGPKGELSLVPRPEVTIDVQESEIVIKPVDDERETRAFHGMTRALIQNMVTGVTEGYERKLEINGVGYGASLKGNQVELTLGFSKPVFYEVPPTVSVEVPSPTSVVIKGCDKQQVGLVASEIRKLRPPEPYKGKGVKYAEEIIKRKAGKAFGSA